MLRKILALCIVFLCNAEVDQRKVEKVRKIIEAVEGSLPFPITASIEPGSKPHSRSPSRAIFSCALSPTYTVADASRFAGTIRRAEFLGDLVVAVLPETDNKIKKKFLEYNVTLYNVPVQCSGHYDKRCKVGTSEYPLTMIRYILYQMWALKYTEDSFIMTSDFRDVFFQNNPFKYRIPDWGPEQYQLTVFSEHHPNRVINRCPVTGGSFLSCYGNDIFRKLGTNTISNNGIVFGTRNAIIVYSYLIMQQMDPKMRQGPQTTAKNKNCLAFGADLTFHNYLLHSFTLNEYFDVKVFQQGEGPVNTLGGFHGEKKLLRAALSDWKVIRGEAPFKYVYNWNGELSPVVHQLDRFLASEIAGGYKQNMAVFQHL